MAEKTAAPDKLTAAAARIGVPAPSVRLDDKYRLEQGRIFLSGTQALVRLPLMQRQLDKAAGLETGCFISGYRGSPLGGYDSQLWAAKRFLDAAGVQFTPGVNEDLAATAVWGSQQGDIFNDFDRDGVFAIWYGKGPGVDRSGDALRHANMAGTARHGGVLALAGDDHTAKSSTTAHQCEHALMDAMIPVLNPAGVQEILDYGLIGWAMSRYSGCWVGLKTIAETVESTASVHTDPGRVRIARPEDFELPPGGLNIRWPDSPLQQEERLHRHKVYAALAFARANALDRTVVDGPNRRLGLIASGKSYLDLMQALEDLGLDLDACRALGLAIYKVAMPWPLERVGVRAFCEGLDEVLVVEEKRAVIENQLKEQLYNWQADKRPRVTGKFNAEGAWQLPSWHELTPAMVARVLARRLQAHGVPPGVERRLTFLEAKEKQLAQEQPPLTRLPYFCSGCPHNSSTKLPEGSRALAGIGCHYMVQWMDRNTETFTQMGGEGVLWIGQAPFSNTSHVFVNLGDGTYFHSGSLAVRACVGAGVNVTFKILYNDAVAMTGGQAVDGPLDPAMISRQMAAEGVQRIEVVTDEPEKYPSGTPWASGVTVHHRDALDQVQRSLRESAGVSVLIYDQTCAAEKRRRRKRGTYPDPDKRVMINELVCEGCGDCSAKSNCVSVVPVETELGTKRAIDQSSCNKDFSCVNGFCPSFVTIEGGELAKQSSDGVADGATDRWSTLPEPALPAVGDRPYGILVTGVGGTGVVTIGQLLGMAGHIEGKGASVLDMTGLAQKGGAVMSHVRLGARPEAIQSTKLSAGGADLVLGCDLVVAAGQEALGKIEAGRTRAIVNTHETITGDFTRNPDYSFPGRRLQQRVREAAGQDATEMLEATRIATALMGDSIATNLFMLGYAWQRGTVPLARQSILQAVVLNGVAVESNVRAFEWGRRAAHDRKAVEALVEPADDRETKGWHKLSDSLEETVDRRVAFLRAYQNQAYAARYRQLVERARQAERKVDPESDAFAWAVAKSAFKLMAIKDEYEVARLYTDGQFEQQLTRQFAKAPKVKIHLAPPILAKTDPTTGEPRKTQFGPWIFPVLRVLKRFKPIRGSALDPFAYLSERKHERRLRDDYETRVAELCDGLTARSLPTAVEIAALPQQIRGFGHIKARNAEAAKAREADLLAQFRAPAEPTRQAAE
ncbi:indolepyruvate ferredoxin oxidoreductase [Rhodovibrio sodomensis]|uniref:Indolepyruvate ferredoxin oxidoreductase n=1 Tax=Rhodovibrio sodomensis TaxID=1088 RepID=A0ABS1DJJ3_9PROT|nr:indolepyruvate ferredoxin oxidoreductase family protein [Rhodovibrio sodomensis]MBK1669663.1 indolepyruvate ferredoxin oxidoreductase [Rhodovibrio sodomensis]